MTTSSTQQRPANVARAKIPFMFRFSLLLILIYFNLDVTASYLGVGGKIWPSPFYAVMRLMDFHPLIVYGIFFIRLTIPTFTLGFILYLVFGYKKCPSCDSEYIPKSKQLCYNCWKKSLDQNLSQSTRSS